MDVTCALIFPLGYFEAAGEWYVVCVVIEPYPHPLERGVQQPAALIFT